MSEPFTVRVEFVCPNCGAEGYDTEFSAAEIKSATSVEFDCEECPARLCVDAEVTVRAQLPKEQA